MTRLIAWLDQWAGPIALQVAVAATLILVVALLVSWCLRRSAASLRHRVWALAVLGLLAYPLVQPFLPKVSLGLRMASPVNPSGAGAIAPPESTSFAHTVSPIQNRGLVDEIATRTNESTVPLPVPKQQTADDGGIRFPAVETPTRATAYHWPSILAAIWATGIVIGMGFLVNVCLAASRLVRTATTPADPSWAEMADVLAAQLGVRHRVAVRISDRIAVPVTAGWLRSVILLPSECDGWAGSRRRMVLIHELSHVARSDVLWQIAAKLACVIYWPHPMVWLAARRMRVEREAACDDAVLRDVERPSEYASLLLDVAASLADRPIGMSTAVAMACGRSVEERIRWIVQPGRCRLPIAQRTARWFSGAAILLVLAVGSLSLFAGPAVPAASESATTGGDQNAAAKADSHSQKVGEQVPFEFSVIVAQHVMLLDGKQIVTWPQIEEMIAKRPNPSQTRPKLFVTRGAMEAGRYEPAKKEMWRLHRDYKLVGHVEGSLPPRDDYRYDRIRTADDLKAVEPRATPGMTSLAEAVGVFNYLAQRDAIGKTQPPLSEDEVIAAVRWSLLEPKKLPVSDKTLAALRKVPETRELPPGFELEVITLFQPNNQLEVTRWSVRLRIPSTAGPGHTTCVSIREQPIRSRLIGEEERKVIEKWQKKWQVEGGVTSDEERECEEEKAKAAEIDRSKQAPDKQSNSEPAPVASGTAASVNSARFHLVRGNTTWVGTDNAPLQYCDYEQLCFWLWGPHIVVLPRPTECFFDFYKERTLSPGESRMDVSRAEWPSGQPANITMPGEIDLPTYQLLLQPSVQRALNLSKEQRTKLQHISAEYWSERRQIAGKALDDIEANARKKMAVEDAKAGHKGSEGFVNSSSDKDSSPFSKEVVEKLERQWSIARKQIEDVLTSEQLRTLKDLTFRTFAFGSGAMFEPEVLERLGVTKDQQAKLRALELQLQKERDRRLRSTTAEKMKKILGVLTPQQLAELRKKQPIEQYQDCSNYPYPGLPSHMPDTGATEELGLSEEQQALVRKIIAAHWQSLGSLQLEEQKLAIGDEKGRQAIGEKRRQEMANLRKQIEAALTPKQWARCNEIAFENLAVPYLRIVLSQASGEGGLAQRVVAAASVALGLGLTSEQVATLRTIDAEYFDKPEQVYRELTDKALTAFTPAQQEKLRAEVDRRGW